MPAGRFSVTRITIKKRMRAKLVEVKDQLKHRRHDPIPAQGRWLARILQGHMAYCAMPGNSNAVSAFRYHVTRRWHRALRRRSQRGRVNWERMDRYATRWLPRVRVMHPYPNVRLEPELEAGARCGSSARRDPCEGRPQGRPLPRHRNEVTRSPRSFTRLRACWVVQATVGARPRARTCTRAGDNLYHDQDAQSAQGDGVEVEEVGGRQPARPACIGRSAMSCPLRGALGRLRWRRGSVEPCRHRHSGQARPVLAESGGAPNPGCLGPAARPHPARCR
jgi:hypothetical protein